MNFTSSGFLPQVESSFQTSPSINKEEIVKTDIADDLPKLIN